MWTHAENTLEIYTGWRGIAPNCAGFEWSGFSGIIWTVTQAFPWMTVSIGWDILKLLEPFVEKKIKKYYIQNIKKTTFNFWKNTQEVTMAQCHCYTVPERCRVRVEKIHLINTKCNSPSSTLHQNPWKMASDGFNK